METKLRLPRRMLYRDERWNLLIRPVLEEDAEGMFQAVRESLGELLPFMDWAHLPMTLEGQRERLQKLEGGQEDEWALVVIDQNSGDLLMCTGWHRNRGPNRRALEVGYWTVTSHSNRGLATLITKILTVAALDAMGCDRLGIVCNRQNERSLKVIKNCGFRYEGEVRHYFPEPSQEMLDRGYSPERTCLQYALLPEDREGLPWYQQITENLKIVI